MLTTGKVAILQLLFPTMFGGQMLLAAGNLLFESQHPKLAAAADDPITAIINAVKKKLESCNIFHSGKPILLITGA